MAKCKWFTSFFMGTLVGCLLLGSVHAAPPTTIFAQLMPAKDQSVKPMHQEVVTIQYDHDYYVPVQRLATAIKKGVAESSEQQSFSFEEVLLDEAPQSVQDWVSRSLDQALGQVYEDEAGHTYILVTRGEQPSGGYTIEIEEIVQDHWGTWVHTAETNPNSGQFVTAEVTYPYSLVRVEKLPEDNIYFVKADGEQIPSLPGISYLHPFVEETDNIILFEPIQSEDETTIHGLIRSFNEMAYVTYADSNQKEWIEMAGDGWTYFSKTTTDDHAEAEGMAVSVFGVDGTIETVETDPS